MLRSVLTALRAVLGLEIAAFGDGLAAISNHIGLAANVIQPRIVSCHAEDRAPAHRARANEERGILFLRRSDDLPELL